MLVSVYVAPTRYTPFFLRVTKINREKIDESTFFPPRSPPSFVAAWKIHSLIFKLSSRLLVIFVDEWNFMSMKNYLRNLAGVLYRVFRFLMCVKWMLGSGSHGSFSSKVGVFKLHNCTPMITRLSPLVIFSLFSAKLILIETNGDEYGAKSRGVAWLMKCRARVHLKLQPQRKLHVELDDMPLTLFIFSRSLMQCHLHLHHHRVLTIM